MPPSPSCGLIDGVRLIDPLADPTWDAALASWPKATFFHCSSWARVLNGTYGFSPIYLLGKSAMLPLMEVNSWLTGRRGVALPFSDECEPLAHDADGFAPVWAAAMNEAQIRGWRYLEVRGRPEFVQNARPSTSFWRHEIALSLDEGAQFSQLHPATRRAVRKAQKFGLKIDVSTDVSALHEFYGLLGLTRKRHGVPAQPWKFFAEIHSNILAQKMGCVVLARDDRQAVSGAVFFQRGRHVTFKFGASDIRFQHYRANNLVMWEAIRHHANQGFVSMDLGRTSLVNLGLRQFKRGWGATEQQVDYFRFDLNAGRFLTVPDAATAWYNCVFEYVPVSVSRLVGTMLYKHMA